MRTNYMSVAIVRIVTDKEIRVLLSQKLWRTQVAISTSVTDWMLLSLLLGRKIACKYCYRYTVTDTSQCLRDGQLTETFYCTTYFFPNLFLTFYDFSFGKGSRNAAFAASIDVSLWNGCNDSTDVRHKFNIAKLSCINLWVGAKVLFIKVHSKTARTLWAGYTKLNIIFIKVTSQIRHKNCCYRYIVAIVT